MLLNYDGDSQRDFTHDGGIPACDCNIAPPRPRLERIMSPAELERYLRENIALAHAMQVTVVSVAAEEVVLRAPLAPNINPHGTVFGGSASALAILSAWSLVYVRLRSAGIAAHLVIRRNTMAYEAPILGEFVARSHVDRQGWERFVAAFEKKGSARLEVAATLEFGGRDVAHFVGEFVALRQPSAGL
jgi:thioesterase domain-containing protein